LLCKKLTIAMSSICGSKSG